MDIRVLGPLEVESGGVAIDVGPPKRRALFAALVMYAGRVLAVDELLDALWGEAQPAGGAKTLQVHVSKLRSALRSGGEDVIRTVSPGYVLDVPADAVDVHRFEALAAEGRHRLGADPELAVASLSAARRLVRGAPYADVTAEEFAQPEIRRITGLIHRVDEDLLEARLRRGEHLAVIPELEGLVARRPLRERGYGLLMTALYRAGRQADALRTYQEAHRVLGEQLGIEPGPELRSLEEQILLHDPDLAPDEDTAATRSAPLWGNLPEPLTAFVGRDTELADIRSLARRRRLVTITGPGGSGKTRLAIEAARALDAPHGRWKVRLGQLPPGSDIEPAVRRDLGPLIIGSDLLEGLRTRHTVVVLDNCEHVIDQAAAFAEKLVQLAPHVEVIATSRRPLGVVGETVYPVGPLEVPPPGATTEELVATAAGAMFLARADETMPGFSLASRDADAVVRILRAVDGLPLGVELVVARLRALDLRAVADRLGSRSRMLGVTSRTAEPHQRTLDAVVEWSVGLLDPEDRRMLAELSALHGFFDLSTAEAIAGGDDPSQVAPSLASLVEHSLVQAVRTGDGIRYRLLETIRDVASRLEGAAAGQNSLIDHLLGLAERGELTARLDELGPSVEAAAAFAVERGRAGALHRLLIALAPWLEAEEHLVAPRRWLDAAGVAGRHGNAARLVAARLALLAGDPEDAERWLGRIGKDDPQATMLRARVSRERGDLDRARTLMEAIPVGHGGWEAEWERATVAHPELQGALLERLVDSTRDDHGRATAALGLGWWHLAFGRWAGAEAAFDLADHHLRACADHAGLVIATLGRGDLASAAGDGSTARDLYAAAYRQARHLEAPVEIAIAATRLAGAQVDEAAALLDEAVTAWRGEARQPAMGSTWLAVARWALARGDAERSRRAAERALRVFSDVGRPDGLAAAHAALSSAARQAGDRHGVHDREAVRCVGEVLAVPVILDGRRAPELSSRGAAWSVLRLVGGVTIPVAPWEDGELRDAVRSLEVDVATASAS